MLRRVRIGPSLALISLFVIAVIGVWLTLSHVAPHQETDQAAEATSHDYQNPIAVLLALSDFFGDAFVRAVSLLTENQWIAASTFLLVVVTALLVAVAFGQNRTARRQMRAYVLPENISVFAASQGGVVIEPTQAITAGTQPIAIIEWKNFGQTPAFDVEMVGNACLVPWPVNPALFPRIDWVQGSKQILGPGGKTTKYEIAERPLILTPQNIADMEQGVTAFVVFGVINYRDAFRRKRWTKYRYFAGGPTGVRGTSMAAHDQGNEAN